MAPILPNFSLLIIVLVYLATAIIAFVAVSYAWLMTWAK